MNNYIYIPKGVCGQKFIFTIENNIIKNIVISGGCSGYSQGLIKLCIDEEIDTIIRKLHGIKCGFKGTSCPDQIALALINYKNEKKD